MAHKIFCKRIIFVVITILLLISTVVPSASALLSTRNANTVADAFDFSSDSGSAFTVDAAEILSKALGISISAEEKAYLSSLGFSLKYSEGLSSALITTLPEDDLLLVTAKEKAYTAVNGASVCWKPVSITVDGQQYLFESTADEYTVVISSLLKNKLYDATLEYQTVIKLEGAELSPWINRAYDDAMLAVAAQDAYEQAQKDYEAANSSYQNALKEYELAQLAYKKYTDDIKKYNAELGDYNEYLGKVTVYEAALKKYNEYLDALAVYNAESAEYEKKLDEYKIQQEDYNKYLGYLDKLKALDKKLTALNSAYIQDSVGHILYATIMGDTVAEVMARKNELVNVAGASAADIENAGAATDILQELLTEYSTISDTLDRMKWYKTNYETIKSNFILLYSSLDSLGKNRAVQIKLNNEGKWERYAQFVGQLYIISTGLDDSETFDSNWIFAKTYHIYDLVEECQRLVDDNSASPAGVDIPARVEAIEKPKLPSAPSAKPAEVNPPVKTWDVELASPGEPPVEVKEPIMPEKSDYALELPQAPQISALLVDLAKLVRNGTLVERNETVKNAQLTFTSYFDTTVYLESRPVVIFYDHEGKKILYSTQVYEGEDVVYVGAEPTRASDPEFDYSFIGWVDKNGNPAELSSILENTEVYADYSKTVREYSVVWNVAGNTFSETYKYGQAPSHTVDDSYSDSEYIYYFNGWSPAISEVTGSAEYTAQYTKVAFKDITYSVNFNVGDEVYLKTFTHGELPKFEDFNKKYFSAGYEYVFTGWSPEPTPLYGDAAYTANFERTLVLPAGSNGDSVADMTVTSTTHTVITNETAVDASYAVSEAIKSGTQLVLKLGEAKLTVSNAALQGMQDVACFSIVPLGSVQRSASSDLSWELKITDKNGNAITLNEEILLELPISESSANGGTLGALVNDKACALTVQQNTAYLRVAESGTIKILPYYNIIANTVGNGNVRFDKERFAAGEDVALDIQLESGWKLGGLTYSVNGGDPQQLVLRDGTFVMPEGNVVISAEFAEEEYTVIFMANGVAISTEKYHFGDSVKEPNMSEMLVISEGEKTLTFSGWDAELSTVMSDQIYNAIYKEGTVADKESTYVSPYNSDKLFTIVLPIVLTVIVLGVAALVAWRICKKKGITLPIFKKKQ